MKALLNLMSGIFVMAIAFYSLGCKKEPPATYPVIRIEVPQENQIFTVPDTIAILAQVSHYKPLTFISMAIVDMALTPVTARYYLYPEMNNYDINSNIIITDVAITSGNYYLHIRASDGTNETNSYTKLYIHETPRVLNDIFLATKNAYGTLDMYRMDTAMALEFMTNINSDYGYADIDPVNKLLYVSGKYSNKLFCYNYDDNTFKWNNTVSGYPPAPYFNDLKVFDKKCYCVLRQNAVIAYNPLGTLVYNKPTSTDRYPDKMHFHINYLFTSQYALSGSNAYILLNYTESGGFYQMLLLNLNTVKFFSKDNNHVYIFANDASGNGEIRIYDIESNGVWEPYNLTDGKIISVEEVDNNAYLLAFENKVVRYTYNPSSAVTYCNAAQITHIRFDKVNQKLYVGTEDKRVQRYSYPFAHLEKEIFINDSICDLLLVYNK